MKGKLSSTVLKTSQQGRPSGLVQQDGKIDHKQLQQVFVKYLPRPCAEKRLILGLDATSIERPFSCTSPDRTAMPLHNIPHSVPKKSTAITFGWKYSTVRVLPDSPSSWTYILDQSRIFSDKTDIQVGFGKLSEGLTDFASKDGTLH